MKFKLILWLALVFGGNSFAGIIYPKGPESGPQLVREFAAGILKSNPPFLEGFRLDELTMAEPHRWYAVGPKDIVSGHLLSGASSGCWRYILLHGTNAVGMGTVFDPDAKTGRGLSCSSLYQNAFSKETLTAVRMAKDLPQIKKQDYELRFLGVPAINFVTVWLHGKSDDILIPLPPTFGRKLNAYQAYSEIQIIKVLKPEAQEVMKAPNLER